MSGQAGRYQRSFGGLIGAMVVLVALLVGWVAFRSIFSDNPDSAVRVVDYRADLPAARAAADFDLVAPETLPTGWRSTSVRFTPLPKQAWHLGVLTDDENYVGLEQSDRSVRSMVEEYVDPQARRGGEVDVAGSPWTTYTDSGGDLALVRREGSTTTLVVGSDVAKSDLLSYTASLR